MRNRQILLVEDNPGDVRLTAEALYKTRVRPGLIVAKNGEEALAFLRQKDSFVESTLPDVILLDLKLPGTSGLELLQTIKQDARLKRIPVIVLTSSESEQDLLASYDYHANCYIPKPVDVDQFLGVMNLIERFWLSVAKLPPKPRAAGKHINSASRGS